MPSFITIDPNLDIENAKPPEAAPEGEYLLEVVSCEAKPDKNNDLRINAKMRVQSEDGESYRLVNHNMRVPQQSDKEGDRAQFFEIEKNVLKEFLEAVDLPFSGEIPLDQAVGRQFYGVLTVRDDPTYGLQNDLKRIVSGA